jgi:hypothetical protein
MNTSYFGFPKMGITMQLRHSIQSQQQISDFKSINGGVLKWGYPNSWIAYFMENPIYKWIM